jgi:hypothetical protein
LRRFKDDRLAIREQPTTRIAPLHTKAEVDQ